MTSGKQTSAEIPCPLRKMAKSATHLPAVVDGDLTISFGQLNSLANTVVLELRKHGVEPRDRVAFCLPNTWKTIALMFAVWRLRAVACPVSPRLPPAARRAHADGLGCELFVTSEEFFPSACGRTTTDRRHYDEFIELTGHATILSTSGSSGHPKNALHSYGNHYFSAKGANLNMPLSPGDRWLLDLPLHHVGGIGILFRCLLGGATVVLARGLPAGDFSLVTHVSMVTTQLSRLLRAGQWPYGPDLKAILLGGSAAPIEVLRECAKRRLPVYTTYGLTEMSSQVTTRVTPIESRHLSLHPGHLGDQVSSGRPLPFREISVSGDGEILVKGDTLFHGYVRGDTSHCPPRPPTNAQGWFHTGDTGYFENGELHVTGRKDRMFISGGENIQPEEIESVLSGVPGIEQAIVVPVKDAEFGFRPVAFLKTSRELPAPDKLNGILGEVLPRFKIPVAYHPMPEGMPDATAPESNLAKPNYAKLARSALAPALK